MLKTIKRLTAILVAVTISGLAITEVSAFSPGAMNSPAMSEKPVSDLVTPVRRGRRNLGLGILGAVGAAVIINEAAKADERRARSYGDEDVIEARRCRRLHFRCKDGDDIACDRFDDYC